MPRAGRGVWWWLQPVCDFLSAAVALAIVAVLNEADVFPAVPLAPLVLVVVYALVGVYGSHPARGLFSAEDGSAWPLIRLLLAVLFAWSSSFLLSLDQGMEVLLCGIFLLTDALARKLIAPAVQRLDQLERWMVVGDEAVVSRLKANEPLRAHALIVGWIPVDDDGHTAERTAALEAVDQLRPSRIVISSELADEHRLLTLVYEFKSLGVPVSLLPRLVDLVDPLNTVASQVGGVPLIDVQPLVNKLGVPYEGPDRRHDREVKVSVVVPAMNEAANIGHVLSQLPDGLHEVILVDGNSQDNTIEVARRAYPDICVHTQRGRGKGDAFRVGFAAVTGNLVVMLDADGSADPTEIPRFVATLEAGADFAKGSRFIDGGGSADITPLRRAGNSVLSGTCNALQGTRYTDLCYGYNAFWARCLPFISLDVPGFEVETLINLRVAAAGMRVVEVPSNERKRLSGQSNLKTFRDGFRVLGTILVETRRSRAVRRKQSALRGVGAARNASIDPARS